MRLFIRSDQKGNIISAMKVNIMVEGLEHPYSGLEEGEFVIELEPTSELEALKSHEICEQYSVDTKKKALKKRPEEKIAKKPGRRSGER